jgi:hypothetical protein
VTFGELVRMMVDADLKAVKAALEGGRDAVRANPEGA